MHRDLQESLGPFPWPRNFAFLKEVDVKKPDGDKDSSGVVGIDDPLKLDLGKSIHPSESSSSATSLITSDESCGLDFLEYRTPPVGVPAGSVLQHAKRVMTSLFTKHDPMIFKFGYTHNANWRWHNSLYGYKFARERWTGMIILYDATQPFGPAMLEAALIDAYRSTLIHWIVIVIYIAFKKYIGWLPLNDHRWNFLCFPRITSIQQSSHSNPR